MLSLDKLIFGYVDITVPSELAARAADMILCEGINLRMLPSGSIRLAYRDIGRVRRIFDGKIEYGESAVGGLFGALLSHRRRFGFFTGLLLVTVLFLFLNGFVWDVRVEGGGAEIEGEIIDQLSSGGLRVGERWSRIDKSELEVNTLKISENIAWLNINRRGSVAYVTVFPKLVYDQEDDT